MSSDDTYLVSPKSACYMHLGRDPPPYLLVLTFEGVLASYEKYSNHQGAKDFYEDSDEETDESEDGSSDLQDDYPEM